MTQDIATSVAVIDFRRHGMVLQWHTLAGTWTTYEVPPPLVHGVALIRPSQPNICVFSQADRLHLQIGVQKFVLTENSPRIKCTPGLLSLGLRRRFSVESSSGEVLFRYAYWSQKDQDFFSWLADNADNPSWLLTSALQWSQGVTSEALRSV